MSSPLITAPELLDDLEDRTVLDVRWRLGGPPGEEEYLAGHVPGAAYVDLDTALADPPGTRGRHPLPDPERFGRAMRSAGVRAERAVVVYDDWAGRAAARCWWLLRWAGHGEVRVLDGGWSAWLRAGGPVETGSRSAAPGDFAVTPGSLPILKAAEVLGRALVDARAPERFRGEVEPVDPVAGHVPGARNVPTEANLTLDGRFKDVSALRDLYAGMDGAGVYCGSGVTACHDLLAMEIAGVAGVLYPGSWSEWVTDPKRPVETG